MKIPDKTIKNRAEHFMDFEHPTHSGLSDQHNSWSLPF